MSVEGLSQLFVKIENWHSGADQIRFSAVLDEARSLMEHRHLKSLNTVGYSELFDHLEGKISLDEAIDLIKTHSRQYAKRQLTWFRKHIDAPRFHPKDVDTVMEYVRQEMGL